MRHHLATALLLASPGSVFAGVIVDIPPGSLPAESFFASNPGSTVNVHSGGGILPDADDGAFSFNGATVNLYAEGVSGFFTLDHFMEDVTFNIDGGELVRGVFAGSTGTTTVNVISGLANRGLRLQGNSTATISGGRVGLTGTGMPSITTEDDAVVVMTGGEIDDDALINDRTVFTMSGGTMGDHVFINGDSVFTLAGGSTGRDTRLRSADAVFNVTGGTTGRDFVAEHGTVNISAGALGENSGMVTGTLPNPVVNMTGGALGTGFRAYDGVINISGGLVGDGFRLGPTSGDGSGATCNLFVKSATIDGVDVPLVANSAVVIADRGGAFLSAVLLDDSLIGLHLNESSVFGEDRIRPGSTLTVTLVVADCPADLAEPTGVLDLADITAFTAAFLASSPEADLAEPTGVFDLSDVTAFIDSFVTGCP